MRYSRQSCTLHSTNGQCLNVPKDTAIIIPVYSIHYNSKFYPEPEKFRPERFGDEEMSKRPPYTFLSFGDGPRNCIAASFGLMELQFALATLLSKFRFSVCEKTVERIEFDRKKQFTMSILNGVYLKVELL